MLAEEVESTAMSGSHSNRINSGYAETSSALGRLLRVEKMLSIEWLGQTIASVCWIGSVLAYGISSSGDWLQLIAASAWLLANIAAVVVAGTD